MKRREFLTQLKNSSFLLPLSIVTQSAATNIFTPKDSFFNLKSTLLSNDIFLDSEYIHSLHSVRNKLKYVQRYVGHGNFNIIGFDDTRKVLKRSAKAVDFTREELAFIEYIFYYKPNIHGFYGDRISLDLTNRINRKDVKKIPYTGHFLFKGKPEETYYKITKDIGKTVILTSGVRSIVKQMKLFLDKLNATNYNLSKTSNSIAPPAFTYHTIGDFDVGKKGLGSSNFTARFALTPEFNKIKKLKYIDMRYTINNKDGVRYEPWHVKII